MTDLATGSTPSSTATDAPTALLDAPDAGSDQTAPPSYAWAPQEPRRRSRHLGLWLGIPGGLVVIGAVAASLILIAPGTAIAGVGVGGLTVGGATTALTSRLAATTIQIETPRGEVAVTGAALGASIDAEALAQTAYSQHPLWNVSQWNSEPIEAQVTLDPQRAETALQNALGDAFVQPRDATVTFDPASASYVVGDAVPGTGADLNAVRATLEQAFSRGSAPAVSGAGVEVPASITTAKAQEAATLLNHMLDTAGFYVGTERTVPVDRATLASWLTVRNSDGAVTVSADAAAIAPAVAALPGTVNRAPVDGTVVTNSSGDVLSDITTGVSGRTLGDTSGVAAAFAAQLAGGDAQFVLPVTETAPAVTKLQRSVEVNLSEQRLYLHENGKVVDTWLISSGKPGFETHTGNFRIGWKTPEQTMRGYNGDGTMYETPNVKWAAYFNGDEAFHGVYWHNNFGQQMSHGCVGMPEWRAEQVYDWAPEGVDVSIHY
ncbi:L,D-transpeptidase [Microbacterium sp. SORGH_AS_0888]|uniref:L,D-transpeptidase family protein n=1 Tax=Microbacterium sp. SORGH_AS_0888 TaxID=3041791 RepID=UPI00277EE106|nr:L,D-transpeptidase [Microbacterium sp. SORGH_AS_0888]MDQ1131282.1 lipoprotein-anchoring transpeptidase ErfK/SrfK [Microbacterium sp. SORGH_AS_0888]